jgi:O-antigen ligase
MIVPGKTIHQGESKRYAVLLACAIALLCGIIVGSGQYVIIILAVIAVIALALIIKDVSSIMQLHLAPNNALWLIIGIPFIHIFLTDAVLDTVYQAAVMLLIGLYIVVMPYQDRLDVIARVKPLLIPAFLFFGVWTASYVASGVGERRQAADIINMNLSFAYAILACICCRTTADTEKLLRVLVYGSLLQLPIILGQAAGLSHNLPGTLSVLSADSFGGSLDNSGVKRYPGSFRDYELIAEYLGLAWLIALGFSIYAHKPIIRRVMLLCTAMLLVAGWFTGTRGFIVGIAGGTLIFLFFGFIRRTNLSKLSLVRLVFTVVIGITVVVLFLPTKISSDLIARLSQFNLNDIYSTNRTELFKAWVELAGRMPILGYGSAMTQTVNTYFTSFLVISPHSLYFAMLLTAGYPGLIATLVFVASLCFMSVSTALRAVNIRIRQLGVILLAAILYWATNEIKIEYTRLFFYSDLLFFFFGILASVYVIGQNRRRISTL